MKATILSALLFSAAGTLVASPDSDSLISCKSATAKSTLAVTINPRAADTPYKRIAAFNDGRKLDFFCEYRTAKVYHCETGEEEKAKVSVDVSLASAKPGDKANVVKTEGLYSSGKAEEDVKLTCELGAVVD